MSESSIHEAARRLPSELENSNLHVLEAKAKFVSRRTNDDQEWPTGEHAPDGKVPAALSASVKFQMKHVRNLKFQYLEQSAKKKYIINIMSDEAPSITATDNEAVKVENEEKKRNLRIAKDRLNEKYSDIRTLAPLVEQDYYKAKSLTDEAFALSQKILDARLALTRSKQSYPEPRLTVSSATMQLESQVTEMQGLDEELQKLNAQVVGVKESMKAGTTELERLRAKRAELEKLKISKEDESEDPRFAGLYDWYTASFALHQSLLELETLRTEAENELQLTYIISSGSQSQRLKITLLFVPNTRQLGDVEVSEMGIDVGDLIDAHVQSNDVPGLVVAILARARASL